jgi:hypothetical protein
MAGLLGRSLDLGHSQDYAGREFFLGRPSHPKPASARTNDLFLLSPE